MAFKNMNATSFHKSDPFAHDDQHLHAAPASSMPKQREMASVRQQAADCARGLPRPAMNMPEQRKTKHYCDQEVVLRKHTQEVQSSILNKRTFRIADKLIGNNCISTSGSIQRDAFHAEGGNTVLPGGIQVQPLKQREHVYNN